MTTATALKIGIPTATAVAVFFGWPKLAAAWSKYRGGSDVFPTPAPNPNPAPDPMPMPQGWRCTSSGEEAPHLTPLAVVQTMMALKIPGPTPYLATNAAALAYLQTAEGKLAVKIFQAQAWSLGIQPLRAMTKAKAVDGIMGACTIIALARAVGFAGSGQWVAP